jgi:lysozyme family protein
MAHYDDSSGPSIIEWVLHLEDSTLRGKITHDMDGATRFGLLDKWHPDLVSQGYFLDSMSRDSALALAKEYYRINYWNKIQGDWIWYEICAAELLSFDVNDGPHAIKMAQQVVGQAADGIMGQHTLSAINAMPADDFVSGLVQKQIDWYNQIVAKQPAKAVFLNGWMNRVNRHYPN